MAELPKLRLILPIGGYAMAWHLPDCARRPVRETVSKWREIAGRPGGDGEPDSAVVLPMPHPSWRNSGWLKRNPWFEAELLPELRRRVRAELERCPTSGN